MKVIFIVFAIMFSSIILVPTDAQAMELEINPSDLECTIEYKATRYELNVFAEGIKVYKTTMGNEIDANAAAYKCNSYSRNLDPAEYVVVLNTDETPTSNKWLLAKKIDVLDHPSEASAISFLRSQVSRVESNLRRLESTVRRVESKLNFHRH